MNDVYVISDQRSNRLVALPALDADALGQSLVPPGDVGRLSLPMGLCLDARRRLHVADFGNDRVVTLSFDPGAPAIEVEGVNSDGTLRVVLRIGVDDGTYEFRANVTRWHEKA